MELFNQILNDIKKHPKSSSSFLLANALASACDKKFGRISALDVAVNLDRKNKDLVIRLLNVTHEHDYSNADQVEVLSWLIENGYVSSE